jgi:hypothetical protein
MHRDRGAYRRSGDTGAQFPDPADDLVPEHQGFADHEVADSAAMVVVEI